MISELHPCITFKFIIQMKIYSVILRKNKEKDIFLAIPRMNYLFMESWQMYLYEKRIQLNQQVRKEEVNFTKWNCWLAMKSMPFSNPFILKQYIMHQGRKLRLCWTNRQISGKAAVHFRWNRLLEVVILVIFACLVWKRLSCRDKKMWFSKANK